MKITTAALAGGLLAAVSLATLPPAARPLAAQEPIRLEGLIVTAHRAAVPAWTVPAHATVIEGEELERAGVEKVADALRLASGLAIARSGSFGGLTSLFLRGGESDYVHVLVDGVRVNEPGGSFDFSTLAADNVERIEIVRGPASALYGSDAVSGVVHILTRRGAGRPRGTLSVQTGSFGTTRWEGGLAGGSDDVSYAFSLGGSATDGILEYNNRHERATASGRVRASLDASTDATLSVRYDDSRFHYPTDGTGALVDRNQYSFGDALALRIDAGRRWSDAIETRLFVNLWEADRGIDDAPDGAADTLSFFGYKSLADTRRFTAGGRGSLAVADGATLSAGYEVEQQSVRQFTESLSQWGGSSGNSEREWLNRAAYAQLAWTAGDVALTGGTRLESDERFGDAFTWRAGGAWRPGAGGARLRASAGTGIKEPTFFETYATGFTTGNPDLEPERSTSFEAGADQELGGGAALSVTAFSQSYRDLIQYTGSPPSPTDPNFFNVAQARSRGLETEASVERGPARLALAWTLLDTEVVDAGFDEGPGATFVEGSRLLRRPSSTLSATAFYQAGERLSLDVALRRVGERDDRDFAEWPAAPVVLPAYAALDAAVTFDILDGTSGSSGLALTVRGENLFGAEYEEIWGFAAPGRGLYVGARATFGG